MLYVIAMLMLVSLAAGALLLDRGRRRAAYWSLGIAALLALNLGVYLLVGVLSAL